MVETGIRKWTVGGQSPKPRFQHEDGRQWRGGDTITEEDLRGTYKGDNIEALLEMGALLPIVEELEDVEEETAGASEGSKDDTSEDAAPTGKTDPEGSGPHATGQEETGAGPTGEDSDGPKDSAKPKVAATK